MYRYGKFAMCLIPPEYRVITLRAEDAVNNSDVAIKNATAFPVIAPYTEQESTYRMGYEQLMQVNTLQAYVCRRVGKTGVYSNTIIHSVSIVAYGSFN